MVISGSKTLKKKRMADQSKKETYGSFSASSERDTLVFHSSGGKPSSEASFSRKELRVFLNTLQV